MAEAVLEPRPEAAVDPAEIDAAVLADKLADPLRQREADQAMAEELRVPAWMLGALG